MAARKNFEVIIIGGSYAGLSAALALGRSLKKVLIIDGGVRCNHQTPHAHNFITQDGVEPGVIAARARKDVLAYNTVNLIDDLAVAGEANEEGFIITTKSGAVYQAKKLICASGIKDMMPDIKGFSDCWGISVVHCPYCHGYELRNQKTAIMANGEKAFHLATLVHNLTDDLMIITGGVADFSQDQVASLDSKNIKIIEAELSEIAHENGHVKHAVLKDGQKLAVNAIYAAVPFTQNSDIALTLGCELTESGLLKVNGFQATNVKGIYACGDNTAMMRSIASAVYTGNLAGAMVNKALTFRE